MKNSNDREKAILQKYTDRYMTYITTVVASFIIAAGSIFLAPLFTPQTLPKDVWYPFARETLLRKFIICCAQAFVTLQTVFCLNVDIMIAVFLLYSTARLEIVASEIDRATNETDIVLCVRKQHEIARYIKYLLYIFCSVTAESCVCQLLLLRRCENGYDCEVLLTSILIRYQFD